MTMDLIKRVLLHEGFKSKPYQDHLGVWTIGHGLTFLTELESKHIVEGRLLDLGLKWRSRCPWLKQRDPKLLDVIVEMSFQMGFQGVLNFKNMWRALETEFYHSAAAEMLDSKWAVQTPGRAKELSEIVASLD